MSMMLRVVASDTYMLLRIAIAMNAHKYITARIFSKLFLRNYTFIIELFDCTIFTDIK